MSLKMCKGPHDYDEIIFNYSSHDLSKLLLRKSLYFTDYLQVFQRLYCDIKDSDLHHEKSNLFDQLQSLMVIWFLSTFIQCKLLFIGFSNKIYASVSFKVILNIYKILVKLKQYLKMLQEKFCNLYFENVLHKALGQMYKKMHLST